GNRIHANFFLSKVIGQVTHGRFERGLGYSHHVVVRHNFFGTVISQRENAAAIFHQGRRATGQRDQRINADVVRNAKALSRGVHKVALEFLGGRKADAVHQHVELAVTCFQLGEEALDFFVAGDVAAKRLSARKGQDEVLGFEFQALVLVRDGELRSGGVQGLRDRPRNAALVGNSEDHRGTAFEVYRHWASLENGKDNRGDGRWSPKPMQP